MLLSLVVEPATSNVGTADGIAVGGVEVGSPFVFVVSQLAMVGSNWGTLVGVMVGIGVNVVGEGHAIPGIAHSSGKRVETKFLRLQLHRLRSLYFASRYLLANSVFFALCYISMFTHVRL